MDIFSPISIISGVGNTTASKLGKLGIFSIFDLLYHLPARYEDRSQYSLINKLQPKELVYVAGQVSHSKNIFLPTGKTMQNTKVTDDSGTLDITWFNQPFLLKNFKSGTKVAFWGKVDTFSHKLTMISPDYEIYTTPKPNNLHHIGKIIPVYPETAGLTSKWIRNTIFHLLENLPDDSAWPTPTDLPTWKTSLLNTHFPSHINSASQTLYKNRLAYDELFFISFRVQNRKQLWQKTKLSHPFIINKPAIDRLIGGLPFKLTSSQETAVAQILIDLTQKYPMNRLLQGDVGSGKTIVAAIAAYAAQQNKLQTLILAPTQILANQHYDTLSKTFAKYKLKIGLITGASKPKLLQPTLDIIVGTHALLSEKYSYPKVGLIIIDEQQRFGVLQRARASSLGNSPHVLTMTATPIPRTAALVIHGDLDISLLENLPQNRLPVKTWVVPENKRSDAYSWISNQISQEHAQVFIICPFIDQSETLSSVKSAISEKERLTKVFPKHRLGLLHGRLDSTQKNAILDDFKAGKFDILVSTPVVEVGIDIPTATIMLVEDADRFGLSQLHQLRGRVGRSSSQSYCLLFTSTQSAVARLKLLEKNYSGASLSQLDLQMRGPGQVYGLSQHGNPYKLKVATYEDPQLLEKAKFCAQQALSQVKKYPLLQQLQKTDKISLIHPN